MVSTNLEGSSPSRSVSDVESEPEWSSVHLRQVIQRQLDVGPGQRTSPTLAKDIMDVLIKNEELQPSQETREQSVKAQIKRGIESICSTTIPTSKRKRSGAAAATTTLEQMALDKMEIDEEEMQMIPLMINSDLPEFQKHVGQDGVILAGKSLTWFEFVQMFTQKPEDYILKGKDGCILRFGSKIGEYTNKRRSLCLKEEHSKYHQVIVEKCVHVQPVQRISPTPSSKPEKNETINTQQGSTLKAATNKQSKSSQALNSSPVLPNIKPQVMSFMASKISNRNMLKIREELMKLKEDEDYFKLTALTPMTAGLLEQMLCRNLSTPDSSS